MPPFLEFSELPKFDSVESLVKSLFPDKSKISSTSESGGIRGIGGGEGSSSQRGAVTTPNGEKHPYFVKSFVSGSLPEVWRFVFRREIGFLQQVLPDLTKSGDEIASFMPRCLGAGMVGDDTHIILDDFDAKGYSVVAADDFMKARDVESSMRAIARFHALSYGKNEVMEKWKEPLTDIASAAYFQEFNQDLICKSHPETNLRLMKAVLEAPEEKLPYDIKSNNVSVELLDKLISAAPRFIEVFKHLRSPDGNNKVVIHGDFHMWNVALKKGEDAAMLFDFQVICLGSPVADIQHFLSQSPNQEDRRNMWKQWIEIYMNEFNKVYGKDVMAKEAVEKEYALRAPIGLICGIAYNLRRFVKQEERSVVVKAKNKAVQGGTAEEVVDLLKSCGEEFWKAMQRNFDMVNEYCNDLGALDTIEKILKE